MIINSYTLVPYIVGHGTASNFDTGVSGNNDNLRFEFGIEINKLAKMFAVFGNFVDNDHNCWDFTTGNIDVSTANRQLSCHANDRVSTGFSIGEQGYPSNKMDVILDRSNCTVLFENDTNYITVIHLNGISNNTNIAIGAKSVGLGQISDIETKHYYWKIYDGNTLIRDYVPVIRNSDHAVGLFDKINFTFNPSTGAAPFTYEN